MALSKPESLSLECSELPDQFLFVGDVTLGENARDTMQQKTEKQKQKQRILTAVVALLNSGGGIVCAAVKNENYSYSDGKGLDLEAALTKLVEPSTIEDYFGFSQSGMTFLIFVKTWSSTGGRVRLCSIDTGLRIRSGTSALNVENSAVTDFLMKQKKKKKLAKGQGDEPVAKRRRFLSGDRANGQRLFERQEVQLGEELPFGESVNVELKSFSKEKNLYKRIKDIIPKYTSAFANTDGGYLFIGVDDKTKKVVGCGSGLEKNSIKREVEDICCKVISVHFSGCTQENDCSVEVRILDVLGGNASESLYVVAIHIPKFCCTVFERHPDSWHLEGTEVCQIQVGVWLEKMQITDPDDKELRARFEKMLSPSAAPQKCKSVYGIKDDHLSSLQHKLFPVYEGRITITPDDLKIKLWEKYPNLQKLMPEDSRGVLILSNSWAVDIDRPKNKEVICEALLICEQDYPKLFFMVENGSSDLWEYAKDTAFHLKRKLVNLGGYSEWVCVIPQLVNCETGQLIARDQSSAGTVIGHQYPECYKPENMGVVRALLRALVIVVMSFTSALSNQLGEEFLNLLTFEQFEILHSKFDVEDIRELFVHGYPGTGKTVLATLVIKRIKNTFGCEAGNILYICENAPLKEFIRKENICCSVTRSYFMKGEFPDIKHIIVDEAQNFRLEDGDWYKKAKRVVEPGNGVFWVFLDYFQQSHTLPSGLPSPSRQTNKIILEKSLRNSVAVHDVVCKQLDRIRENTSEVQKDVEGHMKKMIKQKICMHSFQGCYKKIIATENCVISKLTSLVKDLQKQGNSPKDIAILGSILDDVSSYRSHLNRTTDLPLGPAEYIDENVVVVDSVRRFSGLERNIVIVINPAVHWSQGTIMRHFFVSAISRARIQLYVIFVK
ncbi:schlafen family member 13-like isoform X2 [Brienomyrus brachyistius]|uniref:schlafen family member 13-like isoform X2 n=1 Tax=Brienomyrus brachyistius TaxID=42636 RepID=UPI0020B279F6|nr:schlafen family member 13-like isoform X2 [Brienomyrus brachyistius]